MLVRGQSVEHFAVQSDTRWCSTLAVPVWDVVAVSSTTGQQQTTVVEKARWKNRPQNFWQHRHPPQKPLLFSSHPGLRS